MLEAWDGTPLNQEVSKDDAENDDKGAGGHEVAAPEGSDEESFGSEGEFEPASDEEDMPATARNIRSETKHLADQPEQEKAQEKEATENEAEKSDSPGNLAVSTTSGV